MNRFDYIKDMVTAVSLSHLCFFCACQAVVTNQQFDGYYLTNPSLRRISAALMLDVLLLATFFLTAYSFARRQQKKPLLVLARWVFLFVVFAALDGVRRQFY